MYNFEEFVRIETSQVLEIESFSYSSIKANDLSMILIFGIEFDAESSISRLKWTVESDN